MKRTEHIIKEVNALRSMGAQGYFSGPDFSGLIKSIQSTDYLQGEEIVECFVDDLTSYPKQKSLLKTKAYINSSSENVIFSLFSASYFPSLNLEYMKYQTLPVPDDIQKKYPSPTVAILPTHYTEGLLPIEVVALFPENHIGGTQEPTDKIFYLINKFLERHSTITRAVCDLAVTNDGFQQIRNATDTQITNASVLWVHLHEYFHRVGAMPIPIYLKLKSFKPLAGLEEMRVDVLAMLTCLTDPRIQDTFAFEFILSERLLRYSVQGTFPNYDAIASQLLFNFLLQNGGISIKDDKIKLNQSIPAVLQELINEINLIESGIFFIDPSIVKQNLLAFIAKYTNFNQGMNRYEHIPFFAEIKKKLAV